MQIILNENETMEERISKLVAAFDLVDDIAPIAYWYENLYENGRVKDIHFSDRMREMLGYKSLVDFPDELNTLMTFTHPEDVHIMLDGAIAAGTGKIDKYNVQYRIRMASGDYMWCNATGQLVKDHNGTTVGMYGSFIDISEKKELEQERINQIESDAINKALGDNNASILALEDHFESMYDVELETGRYSVFIKGETYDKEIKDKLKEIKEYYSDLRQNIYMVVYPEDREKTYSVLSKEGIIKGLTDKDHFDYYYRVMANNKPVWFKIRVVYKNAEKKNVIIGVFNAEAEVAVRQKEEEQRRTLINQMAGDNATFIIDCENNIRKTVQDMDYADIYSDANSYSHEINRYIDTSVATAYRELMREVSTPEYMLEHTKDNRDYAIRYRDTAGDVPVYFEMRVKRLSDTEVLQSFSNIDDRVAHEMVRKAITENCYGIYVVDLNNDVAKVVKHSDTLSSIVDWSVVSYSQLIGPYIAGMSAKAKQAWEGLASVEGVRQFLKGEDMRDIVYESPYGENRLDRVTWFVVDRVDGEANLVCAAFAELDEERTDKEKLNEQIAEQKTKLEESLTFTNYFLNTYTTAYYVDLNTRTCSIYKAPTSELGKSFLDATDYLRSLIGFFDMVVHPEDRAELLEVIQPEKMRALLKERPDYTCTFRDVSGETEKIYMLHVIRGADEDHAAFGFRDVTEETRQQQQRLLGAVPISPDILAKENIGMWAFELDEGKPPRMYGDEAMLRLVGLDHQVPPEEMYHAWYDHIEEGSYGLVHDAVDKMMSGEHAEVQYPWHHPDGRTMIVRCGGVRNPEYKKGIRVEGTHQDVSLVLHFDEDEIKLRRRMNMIYSLSDEFDPVIVFDPQSGEYDWYESREEEIERNTPMSRHGESIYEFFVSACDKLIHQEDKERFGAFYTVENMKRIATTGEAQETENRWWQPEKNAYCWKYNKAVRMVDEDGKVYVVIGVTDTTEHKEKEAKLAEQKRQYKESLELAKQQQYMKSFGDMVNAALWSMTINSANEVVEVKWSNEFRRMLGFEETVEDFPDTVEAWIGRLHPEDRKRVETVFYGGLSSDDTENFVYDLEYRLLRKTGEYCWYHAVGRMEYNEDGTRKFYGILFDISQEKQLEQQQLQLEKALDVANEANKSNKLVLGFVNGIKWTYKLDENDEVIAAKYDDTALGKFDVAHPDDPLAWTRLIHPDDREHVMESFQKSLRDRTGKEGFDLAYRLQGIDGKYQWSKVTGRTIINEDGTREITGIAIDVTEQMEKEREQQLQLEEALSMAQSANRAKTTFLNNMSHDIRTPMNAIIGYTGLAASHLDNKDMLKDYLGKIGQSSDHLLSLINDVLDMSRIESGKMNLDEKPENLSDIIHTLRDIVQAELRSKQQDFFIDTVGVNDELVVCDKLRLNQVLLNILSNAIKYTPAGGIVSMRITEKTIKPSGYATYEFLIKDNGMGMSKEFLDTIFDPFTRVKSSTVSGIQGTGLGMAITKNIIDMMGGRIDIASEPGKGTDVTVVFDFKLQSAPKVPAEIPELKGVRALIADDDSNTCLSICNMVKDIGMRFEWCTSGKEAVIRAEAAYRGGDSFRVYIIDWIMPDMNGIETTRRIRKVIGDDTPIIILTAYDWSDIEEEAREAGVTAFVSKPMFPSDLHRVLNSCIGKEEEKAEATVAEYDFDGKKILLVEDNELNREIAVALLEESGFIVDTAEDGDIAVEKMKAAKVGDYDLVLMDIQMPRMDGYEATRQIRALGTEISRIPILAMTANAFEEDRKAALEAGMNEHIAKPIDVEKLKETLARFLR